MNDEQTSIFNHIIDSVMEYQQSPDVPNTRPEAEPWKTYLVDAICSRLRQ